MTIARSNPGATEVRLARLWWKDLPEAKKGSLSIWDILALYAEYTLATRSVGFDGERVATQVHDPPHRS